MSTMSGKRKNVDVDDSSYVPTKAEKEEIRQQAQQIKEEYDRGEIYMLPQEESDAFVKN